jgi:phosphoglycerate dehydrogenase-like enzyme
MADVVEVVSLARLSPDEIRRIEAVDPRLKVSEVSEWYDGEIRERWPAQMTRNLPQPKSQPPAKAERDAALAKAEIIIAGYPYPMDVQARSSRLKWFHQRAAGANNLWYGDMWGAKCTVTTGRGNVGPKAIAEYCVAALFYFARDFRQAEADKAHAKFDRGLYTFSMVSGSTVCIVGAGGIGQEAGKRLAALGARVVGTRRDPTGPLPEGFSELRGPDELHALLGQSDAAILCVQLTQATKGLMNRAAFQAMKKGAILINIARGEVVDEDALVEALTSGHLGGAMLDVYIGENDHPPPSELWSHPRVLITPHNSGRGDPVRSFGMDVFCDNLRAYLDGRPLANVIDWERGY